MSKCDGCDFRRPSNGNEQMQLSQRFEIVSRDVLNYHAIDNNVLTNANGKHGARGQCHDC